MRLPPLLCATALALVAVTAAAQDDAPPAGNGLGDLSETLNGLSDETANQAVETPAELHSAKTALDQAEAAWADERRDCLLY